MAAATDTGGVFFAEDVFVAMGSVLLIVGSTSSKIVLDPIHVSVWAILTALAAFAIHGARLLFDRRLARGAKR